MERAEKDERVRLQLDNAWAAYTASKQQYEEDEKHRKKAKTKEDAEATTGDDRDEDANYHPSEDAGDSDVVFSHPSNQAEGN